MESFALTWWWWGISGVVWETLCVLMNYICLVFHWLSQFPWTLCVEENELHTSAFLFGTYLFPLFITTLSMTFCVVQLPISLFFHGFWMLIYKTVLTEHSWFHLSCSDLWQLKLSFNFRNLNCCIKVVSIYGGPCVVLMPCRTDSSVIHEVWCEPLETPIASMPFVEHPPTPVAPATQQDIDT